MDAMKTAYEILRQNAEIRYNSMILFGFIIWCIPQPFQDSEASSPPSHLNSNSLELKHRILKLLQLTRTKS
ncbi:unnamed protein product [Sphenostylis stenocarpa]|uniref:Uncharacterized protein n=1 Tax=Sphenostylis stenocarpa TaxID=92480 RepID=A0AA86S5X2_9FABA|nr:unnamed protein product [Sphenostylis stenocarpa]